MRSYIAAEPGLMHVICVCLGVCVCRGGWYVCSVVAGVELPMEKYARAAREGWFGCRRHYRLLNGRLVFFFVSAE